MLRSSKTQRLGWHRKKGHRKTSGLGEHLCHQTASQTKGGTAGIVPRGPLPVWRCVPGCLSPSQAACQAIIAADTLRAGEFSSPRAAVGAGGGESDPALPRCPLGHLRPSPAAFPGLFSAILAGPPPLEVFPDRPGVTGGTPSSSTSPHHCSSRDRKFP